MSIAGAFAELEAKGVTLEVGPEVGVNFRVIAEVGFVRIPGQTLQESMGTVREIFERHGVYAVWETEEQILVTPVEAQLSTPPRTHVHDNRSLPEDWTKTLENVNGRYSIRYAPPSPAQI